MFNFNLSNGQLKYSGNEYRVPSPNFVCCCPTRAEEDSEIDPRDERIDGEMLISSIGGSASPSLSDSEDSTVPLWDGGGRRHRFSSSEENIKEELAKANREIELLRKLLAEKA